MTEKRRLPTVQARVKTLSPKLTPIGVQAPTYGRGRGGRPWRRKREAVLKRDGNLCQPCNRSGKLQIAHEVDHIVPMSEGGSDDEANLEAICTGCHKVKTAAEQRHART